MGLFGNSNKEDKQKNKILQKAQKFARKGQIDKAVAEWESLLKDKAEDANVYNTIGDLYLKGNQKENALDAYRKASKIYADTGFSLKAIAVNKKILKLDPHNLDALTFMAQLNQERGMINNAKECYLAIAEHHIKAGTHEKALEAYQHIVDMDPKNLKVKLGLAELYLKEQMVQEGSSIYGEIIGALLEQAKYEEAERLCKKLEESLSSPDASLRYMVQIHLAQDRIDEAHNCFSKLEDSSDEDPDLAVLKAEILIRKGQADEGLSLIQSIDRHAVTEFSRVKIFRFLLKAKNVDQALEILDDLSDKYTESRRVDELLSLYHQVLDHDADCLRARHRVVDILKKMKRDQELVQQYKEIGRIYAASGQTDEARNIYEKVLDMNPGDLEVQAHLKTLNGESVGTENLEFGEVELDTVTDAQTVSTPEEVPAAAEEIVIETFEAETATVSDEAAPTEAQGVEGDKEGVDLPEEDVKEVEVVQETSEARLAFLADNITEADVYMKYGHMKKAMVHLEKNLEADPKHVQTHERLLQIFAEQGNTREQVTTLVILAKLYQGQGDHTKAEEALHEVLALDPDHGEAQKLLKEGPTAVSSSALDEKPAEEESLQFEFNDEEQGDEIPVVGETHEIELSEDLAADEESISEFLDEANFYLQQGMVDEARVIYEKILSLHPSRTDINAKLEAIAGNGEKEAPPVDEIAQMFSDVAQEVIDDEAESAGIVEEDTDQVSEPSEPQAEESPAAISEEFSSFAEELRQEIDSSASGIFQETGSDSAPMEDELDFSSELRREVEQSIASDGEAFGENDVMDIFNEFREGVQRELGDEDHETHYNLGIAYLEMGLLDEAREEFVIASNEPKRLMDCVTMIGLCYIQKGEFQKALAELEKGLAVEGRTDEEFIGVRYEISKVSELLGQKERAVQELLWIHEINPGYRDVSTKLKELGVSQKVESQGGPKAESKKNKVSYL